MYIQVYVYKTIKIGYKFERDKWVHEKGRREESKDQMI